MKTKCARCGERGGKFRFVGNGKWVHIGRCSPAQKSRDGMHKNWPLVTSNILGSSHPPMVIENLAQLRRVENQMGVSSDAYNMDRSNRSE